MYLSQQFPRNNDKWSENTLALPLTLNTYCAMKAAKTTWPQTQETSWGWAKISHTGTVAILIRPYKS